MRMTAQVKSYIIIAILSLALIGVAIFALKPKPVVYDEKLINSRLIELATENTKLKVENSEYKKEKSSDKIKIDSLQNLKPAITTHYEKKSKQIDSASTNNIVSDFTSVFSKGNIK